MNFTEKLSQLRLPSGRNDALEQERLLKLFWNRAELKKELQGLDEQLHALRNRLKQQENANQRLQDQLEQLEVRLGNPAQAHAALVHFGLKAVWRNCREQIERYAEELKRQRQDGERKQQLLQFQQDREERRKEAAERLGQAEEVAEAESQRLAERQARMGRLRHFWNYFRRRDLAVEIEAQQQRCLSADQQLADMRESQRTIEKEPWPEFGGLTLEGRRAVNVAIIAYGQHLYASLAVSGLARDARLANNRGVEAAGPGELEASLRRLAEIASGLEVTRSQDGVAESIRRRSSAIVASASWREALDTVPQPSSLPPAATGGVPDANVLVEDYWDIYKVLLR